MEVVSFCYTLDMNHFNASTVETTMKAAFIREVGPTGTHYLRRTTHSLPSKRNQVLIRVGAVAVNPIDTYIRAGANYFTLPFPYIVGCDLAGTVVELGEGVTAFSVGDRVWGSNQGIFGRQGTFAEYAAVDVEWLFRTPDDVSDEAAAAQALVGITTHLGLFLRADLQPGETVMVNGGSGGIGSTVIQMARARGARVIATAGSEEKCDACREWGAELVVDYRETDLEERVRGLAPEGVDLFWDTTRNPRLGSKRGLACPLWSNDFNGGSGCTSTVPRWALLFKILYALGSGDVCCVRRATKNLWRSDRSRPRIRRARAAN